MQAGRRRRRIKLCALCSLSNCESHRWVTSISRAAVGEGVVGVASQRANQSEARPASFSARRPAKFLRRASNVSQLGGVLALYGSCSRQPPTSVGYLWLNGACDPGSSLSRRATEIFSCCRGGSDWVDFGSHVLSCYCCACILSCFGRESKMPVHCYSRSLSYHDRTVV